MSKQENYHDGASNLTIEQVQKANNWREVKYDEEFCAKLGLPPDPSPTSEA